MNNGKKISLLLIVTLLSATTAVSMTPAQRATLSRIRRVRTPYGFGRPISQVPSTGPRSTQPYGSVPATRKSWWTSSFSRQQPSAQQARSLATKAVPSGADTVLLIEAIKSGSTEKLYELIKRGLVDINARYENNDTILHIAAEDASPEIISILIDAGANVHAKNGNYYTPLHTAVSNDRVEAVKLLVARGANPNETDSKLGSVLPSLLSKLLSTGKCPLYLAQEIDNPSKKTLEIIKFLEPLTDKSLWFVITPEVALHRAVLFRRVQTVRHLLLEHTFSSDLLSSELRTASNRRDAEAELLALLIGAGADVNTKDVWERTPLHRAAYNGNLEVVKLLLAKGANPNALDQNEKTPLDRAKEDPFPSEDTPKIIALLEPLTNKRTKVSGTSSSVPASLEDELALLRKAIRSHSAEPLRQLLAQYAFRKEALNRALIDAAEGSSDVRAEMIALLLDAGADINTRESFWKRTALHVAVNYSNPASVGILISRGANPNTLDSKRKSPLYLAQQEDIPSKATLAIIKVLEPITDKSLWFVVTPEVMLRRAVKRGSAQEVRSALEMEQEPFKAEEKPSASRAQGPEAETKTKEQPKTSETSQQPKQQPKPKTDQPKVETSSSDSEETKEKKREDELFKALDQVTDKKGVQIILGIDINSSKEETKKAYLNWIKKHHPDTYNNPALKKVANIVITYINANK